MLQLFLRVNIYYYYNHSTEKNTPPVANAGGDQSITLPVNAIYLNGTKSSDDLGIVRYTWTRDGSSLAIGTIVGNSSSEPVLIVRKKNVRLFSKTTLSVPFII